MLAIALAMLVSAAAQASGDMDWDDDRFEVGRHNDETAVEYEARICEARKVWQAGYTHIDSNMLWSDDRDFQRTMVQ